MLPPDIVAKLHECATQNFIAARDNWFVWLSRSTKCVVFGLILELPELAYETINFARNRIDRLRYRVLLPEDRLEKAKLVAFVGWFLIVVGVAGEWYAGAKIDDLSARIQGCNEARLAEVAEQSGDANAHASAAYERASENEKETAATLKQAEQERADAAKSLAAAETARKEAEGFQLQIAQADERSAQAKAEAARATAEAAKANLELARLKTARKLSKEQLNRIRSKVQPFAGTPFDLWVTVDSDSTALMELIDAMLRSAGWKFNLPGNPMTFSGKAGMMATSGVSIHVPAEHEAEWGSAVLALTNALIFEGIPATPLSDTAAAEHDKPRDRIHVMIGSKPLN